MMKPFILNVDPDTTVQSHQLEHQLDSCDPLACVLFSHAPSVEVYFALRTRLESSTETWLQEFISLDGLDSLLDSLGHMCGPKFNGFSDAILQIDCLSCIRAILNSKIGIIALINSQNGVKKLMKGVDLVNTLPRKHVFEILSAVCVYNNLGYMKIMDAMEKYRREQHHVHKVSFIVNELKMAETIPHKTSLLTFINAIISSTPDKSQRCRIRIEFAGLGLFDVISFLQREETDEDLCVQLQVFQDKMHDDESTMNSELSIDCNCPQDLVDTIQSKVFGGPKMVCFVNILQDLLAIETLKKEKSDIIWKVLERHIHHIVHANDDTETHLFDDTESACFAFTTAVESDQLSSHCCCPSTNNPNHPKDTPDLQFEKHKRLNRMSSTLSMKKDSSSKTSADSGFIGCDEKLSPTGCEVSDPLNGENKENFLSNEKKPPYCPLKNITAKDSQSGNRKSQEEENVPYTLGANLNMDNINDKQNKKHLSLYDNVTPVRNAPKDKEMNAPSNHLDDLDTQRKILSSGEALHDNDTPKLNVQKHPDYENLEKDKVFKNAAQEHGKSNIITHQMRHIENEEMSESNEIFLPTKVMRNLKWIKLDGSLIDEYPQAVWKKMKTERQKIKPDFSQVEEMFHEQYDEKMAETPLLSKETRLSINLFLSRCDEEPTELVKKLVRVDGPGLSLPYMKHLSEIIPDADEVKHLKFYNGNLLELGQAEQFILHLSDVPDYEIVLIGQLQKAEFRSMASRLRMVLNSMLDSARAILASKGLKEIFLLVLKLGNFCNHGQYNGYASGFKLSSLSRLADLKSKEPGHTLVHYLTSCIEKQDSNLLNFLKDIPQLEKAASYSLATIKADFDKMNTQINSFVRQLANANPIIRNGFDSFLEEVKREFRNLQSQISQLKVQSKSLAAYFCESDSFELQACFKALLEFFQELRLCQQEVKLIKVQKTTAAKHTNMFSQQIQHKHLALQFGQKAGASSSMMEEKRCIVDTLLTELHRGNFAPVILRTIPRAKESPGQLTVSQQLPLASTLAKLPSITPVMSAPCIVSTTPNRSTDNLMELSHISLMGTPMMNRPGIEIFEEDITITANKPITSSENDLLDDRGVNTQKRMKAPAVPMSKPLTKTAADRGKGHYRSRSDLADSININTKWIRYHDRLKLEKAPLAKPESSITVATLNLEAGSSTRRLYPENEAMTLIRGPTLALPPSGTPENDMNKQGKKPSAFGKMINKIARRVLKPRNSDINDHIEVDENLLAAFRKNKKREAKMEKAYSLGRAAGLSAMKRESEKENICEAELALNDQFDRQTKNPIRLSNRFKHKLIK